MNRDITALAAEIIGEENCFQNEAMSKHTTFRVGGVADLYLKPQSASHLVDLIDLYKRKNEPYYVIGNGSNILVGDKGIRGTVIEIGKNIGNVKLCDDNCTIHAESGILLSKLAMFAAKNSLSGLEFASGIPGSLGGAIYMNAGAYGGEIKDVVTEVTYLDTDGNVKKISEKDCDFSYRHSCFEENNCIILSASLKLIPDDNKKILKKMKELSEKRISKQPVDKASAGSTFKRPDGYFAAALIEECGLKGYTSGNAAVSDKHSGFVVNNGGATAKDVCDVISHVQNTVKSKTGIQLETEVKLLGEF